jgi:hypothetical protein
MWLFSRRPTRGNTSGIAAACAWGGVGGGASTGFVRCGRSRCNSADTSITPEVIRARIDSMDQRVRALAAEQAAQGRPIDELLTQRVGSIRSRLDVGESPESLAPESASLLREVDALLSEAAGRVLTYLGRGRAPAVGASARGAEAWAPHSACAPQGLKRARRWGAEDRRRRAASDEGFRS